MTQYMDMKDTSMTFAEEVALGAYLFRLQAAREEVMDQVFKRAYKLLNEQSDADKATNIPVSIVVYGPERIYLDMLIGAQRNGVVLGDSVDCRIQGMLLEARRS